MGKVTGKSEIIISLYLKICGIIRRRIHPASEHTSVEFHFSVIEAIAAHSALICRLVSLRIGCFQGK